VSTLFGHRFEAKHHLKLFKTSAIDPQRAAQACEATAQAWQDNLEEIVRKQHEQDPVLFPWKTLAEVPDWRKHNMDEIGENGITNREKRMCTDTMLNAEWIKVSGALKKDESYLKRVFEVTVGDNGDMIPHRSLCVTTCGSGEFSKKSVAKDGTVSHSRGACAPVLIHASKAKTVPDPEKVTPDMTANIYYDDAGNDTGIKVRRIMESP
jgi:hypothetical protein